MEFKIKGAKYRTAKPDVFQQLKVSHKLLPVLAGLVSDSGTLESMMARDSESKLVFGEKRAFDALDIILPKIANTLAALPEKDVNTVIHPYLDAIVCRHEKEWVKIFDQGALIFDGVDLFMILQLVAWVVADSLGNFLRELPDSGTSTQP